MSVVLDTRDLDEARERVGAAYCPHRLEVLPGERPFHAVQQEANCGSISVHSLEYGATMLVDPVPLGAWLLVSSPMRGRLRVRSGRRERTLGVGDTVVLDPFRKFSLSFEDDCKLRTVRFERRLVERVLGEISDSGARGPVEFGLGAPRSPRAAAIWRTVSAVVERQALTGDSDDYPLLQAELARTAVAALAETHPMRVGADGPGGQVLPSRLRRVVAWIEDHPERPSCSADLALVAGLSVRALQEAFQRHFGTTPLGYLRQVRLRRAHEELLRAGDGVTVTEVAYRWGFGNLGRFARAYAERYGCHPSQTLQR